MAKAGLITFHFNHHYGAQLQAYATMSVMERLGYPCEIIDYRLPHTDREYALFKKSLSPKKLLADLHTVLNYNQMKKRHDRFEGFISDFMKLTPKRYSSNDELKSDIPSYDLYIAGSDQIWNPYMYPDRRFDPALFLDFAADRRCITYAPSFGISKIPAEMWGELREYLQRFSAISVREQRGAEIVMKVSGRHAETVLDPAMLLPADEWAKIAEPPGYEEPYILCYFISDFSAMSPYVKELAESTGMPVIQLAGIRKKVPSAKKIVFDAGPKEFLGWFQNAAYVITNSFHGAVFSVQFKKPFLMSIHQSEKSSPQTSRAYNLLDMLGLSNRIIGMENSARIIDGIDYEGVYDRLQKARGSSLEYLKKAVTAENPPPLEKALPPSAKDRCTGCTACASICPVNAISMVGDGEGFLYPHVDNSCVLCGQCADACPVGRRVDKDKPETAYAVWNRDDAARAESSSGGFFSVLADYVLSQGGVVFGAAFDENLYLRHTTAETAGDLPPLRSSKYVQSDLSVSFSRVKELLENGKTVLFSGTSCQVYGLYSYLGKDYENLITCDLVCHGVPSPMVFEGYVKSLEERFGSRIKSLNFRDKSKGWKNAHLTALFENGEKYSEKLYFTEYGRAFGMQLISRPCCSRCEYTTTARASDFTLGDFWGFEPDTGDTNEISEGVSMVLIGSQKGGEIFERLRDKITVSPRPVSEAIAGNPRLSSPHASNPNRTAFFRDFETMPYAEVQKKRMSIPPIHYRVLSKIISPKLKAKLRSIMRG